jgi:hypothetical protein
MKIRILALVLALSMVLCGCGKKKTVSCDRCGAPQEVKADSNITDEWIVYCDECYTELFGEEGLVSPG